MFGAGFVELSVRGFFCISFSLKALFHWGKVDKSTKVDISGYLAISPNGMGISHKSCRTKLEAIPLPLAHIHLMRRNRKRSDLRELCKKP